MNDLTPTFERESGLVILEGRASGVAGEAPLTPLPGLSLAFDRVDGQLCRAIITTCETAGFTGVSEQVAEMLVRLFGAEAPGVLADAARSPREASRAARALCPEPGLAGTLSSLARLDAARATSPVPPDSPWWAAEAAELAERAGLAGRARAEAHHALVKLVGQLGRLDAVMLPEQAVRAARTVAAIRAATEPAAANRLRAALGDGIGKWSPRPGRSGPRLATPSPVPVFDVATEVESLDKDRLDLIGLHWMVDPRWVPKGLFQAGLSPNSDLFIRYEGAHGRVTAEALLAPGADCDALSGYLVRIVDPSIRRVLAQAGFTVAQSQARADLQPGFPLDELPESWVEVGPANLWPVRSAKVYRIRRALRWADAALRAERAPAALASASARGDWAALAAAAWERCCRDWAATNDADRAQAARRRAAIASRTYDPRAPSVAAAEVPCQAPIDGPAYLAEILGS
jgi:hypothetical protein